MPRDDWGGPRSSGILDSWARKFQRETKKLAEKYRDALPKRREASKRRSKAWREEHPKDRREYFKKLGKTTERKAKMAAAAKAYRARKKNRAA